MTFRKTTTLSICSTQLCCCLLCLEVNTLHSLKSKCNYKTGRSSSFMYIRRPKSHESSLTDSHQITTVTAKSKYSWRTSVSTVLTGTWCDSHCYKNILCDMTNQCTLRDMTDFLVSNLDQVIDWRLGLRCCKQVKYRWAITVEIRQLNYPINVCVSSSRKLDDVMPLVI